MTTTRNQIICPQHSDSVVSKEEERGQKIPKSAFILFALALWCGRSVIPISKDLKIS